MMRRKGAAPISRASPGWVRICKLLAPFMVVGSTLLMLFHIMSPTDRLWPARNKVPVQEQDVISLSSSGVVSTTQSQALPITPRVKTLLLSSPSHSSLLPPGTATIQCPASLPYGVQWGTPDQIEGCFVKSEKQGGKGSAVFIDVGNTVQERNTLFAIRQLRQGNPTIHITWLLPKNMAENKVVQSAASCLAVSIVALEGLSADSHVARLTSLMTTKPSTDSTSHSISRLVYALAYAKTRAGIKAERKPSLKPRIFLVDVTTLVYADLTAYAQRLADCGAKMAFAKKGSDRVDLGVVFSDGVEPLQHMVEYLLDKYALTNEDLHKLLKAQGIDLGDQSALEWPASAELVVEMYRREEESRQELGELPSSTMHVSREGDTVSTCIANSTHLLFDVGNHGLWHFGDAVSGKVHVAEEDGGTGAYDQQDPRTLELAWCREALCTAPYVRSLPGKGDVHTRLATVRVPSGRLDPHVSACVLRPLDTTRAIFDKQWIDGLERSLKAHNDMYGPTNAVDELFPGQQSTGQWTHFNKVRVPTYPFVSGDAFRALCPHRCADYATEGKRRCKVDLERLVDGDCIFIEMLEHQSGRTSDAYIRAFFDEVLPNLTKKVVLVSHNGDMSAPDSDKFWRKGERINWPSHEYAQTAQSSPMIIRWFTANCYWGAKQKPSKITCLPIGIENRYAAKGAGHDPDPTKYIHLMRKRASIVPTKLIMGGGWTEHGKLAPERTHAIRELTKLGFISMPLKGSKKGWAEWALDAMQHRFIICPWGHGLDTHRTWETLMLGAFPVVRSSTLDSMYQGLPVVIVKEWTDLSPKMLEDKYKEFMASHSLRMEKIFFASWRHEIRQAQHLGWSLQPS